MKLEQQSAVEIGKAIAAGQTTSREVTQYFLDRISKLNGQLNCFVHVDPEQALGDAAAADQRIAAGQPNLSPLAGSADCAERYSVYARRADHLRLAHVGQLSPPL